jgi:hypothetical protein
MMLHELDPRAVRFAVLVNPCRPRVARHSDDVNPPLNQIGRKFWQPV